MEILVASPLSLLDPHPPTTRARFLGGKYIPPPRADYESSHSVSTQPTEREEGTDLGSTYDAATRTQEVSEWLHTMQEKAG